MTDSWMDNGAVGILEDSLSTLARLADSLSDVLAKQDALEDELKSVKAERMNLERDQIPGLLHQHGLSEIKLKDGRQIVVKTELSAKLPAAPDSRRVVLEWLEENGGGGLIHDELKLEDPSESLINGLIDRGETFTRGAVVNTSSLKALLRELLGL